jgi:hypothetical protein
VKLSSERNVEKVSSIVLREAAAWTVCSLT